MTTRKPKAAVAPPRGLLRRNPIKIITAVLTLVGALGAAVAAGPNLEPLLPATHWFARKQASDVKDQLSPQIKELRIGRLEDDRSRMEGSARSLDAEETAWRARLPTEGDVQTRQIIERRLDSIKVERAALVARVRSIEDKIKNVNDQ